MHDIKDTLHIYERGRNVLMSTVSLVPKSLVRKILFHVFWHFHFFGRLLITCLTIKIGSHFFRDFRVNVLVESSEMFRINRERHKYRFNYAETQQVIVICVFTSL